MTAFSVNMRNVLNRQEITVYELAKKANISNTSIYRYLNSERNPKKNTIKKIANALNVSEAELTEKGNETNINIIKELKPRPFAKWMCDIIENYCDYCSLGSISCDYNCEKHICEWLESEVEE